MEKSRIQALRKYRFLSCHRFQVFSASKKYEESLLLTVNNDGGSINFTFTDLSTNEATSFDNPQTGEYAINLKKGNKIRLEIKAIKAIGSYKIVRKTIV